MMADQALNDVKGAEADQHRSNGKHGRQVQVSPLRCAP